MPRLNLTLNIQLQEGIVSEVVAELTSLTQRLLNKRADVTRVHIYQNQCFVDATKLTDSSVFDLVIYITKGTNTYEQKERWIHAVNQYLVGKLGGEQRQPDYITIHELAPQDWGYNGLSMSARVNS